MDFSPQPFRLNNKLPLPATGLMLACKFFADQVGE
jgi:hypothetical protein